uniref:Protein strawberry notch n=1 Tax=Globodera pallida TaxID=36090 RepID=A0A183BL61_GLOPA
MNSSETVPSELPPDFDEADNAHQTQVDTFVRYTPLRLRSGFPHPDEVVETLSLGSVSSPEIRYALAVPDEVVDGGLISNLQLEAALYACQAHQRYLPSGERIGYLIGDGAGVGKGRTIAAIILENYLRGRRKAIWLSVSSDLKYDAERDLRDIGADKIAVHALNKLRYGRIGARGVIFSTYSSLIGESRAQSKGGQKSANDDCNSSNNTRLRQLVQWCGREFDGVIVFDECHRAKNLCPTAGSKPTKTGKVVLELQQALPGARIVYASATGATEPRNMAYMSRLGLWGLGLTFKTFGDFIHAVENRGVGAMEMVAMDMKLRGLYLSRQLSFKGADFSVEETPLTRDFINVYDESVKLWMECRRQFTRALRHIPDSRAGKQNVWARFWAAHQRFFKYMCISAKVDSCVRIALEAIKSQKCVVIGLQSTGESQTLDFLDENGGDVTEFVSTAKAVIQSLVENYFPTHNDNSAIDDFERMFLKDGTKSKKRMAWRNNVNENQSAKRSKLHFTDGLTTERESGGNSEFEESEAYDLLDEDEEQSGDESGMSSSFSDDDDGDELSAESGGDSDEEELERLLKAEKGGMVGEDEVASDKDTNDSFGAAGEVNPFCMDLAVEDPWAHVQQRQNANADRQRSDVAAPSKAESEATERQRLLRRRKRKAELKRKKQQQQEALIKATVSNITCTASAEQFIAETNIIDGSQEDDADGSVNLTEIKANLLAAVERLGKMLPPNTLDSLINLFGGHNFVAEMTGRRGRVVAREATGEVAYELRTADSDASLEMMNMIEKDKFMRGEKLVAIISEAASSGISLQSDKRAMNRRRRVHITLELPWSADKAIQQFGRTHRSNQESAPEYLFLISELAGEKRFASIVAKRLESLGALTQGDRRATTEARDLSQFNIDTNFGREALEVLLRTLTGVSAPIVPPPSDYTAGDFFGDMRAYMEGVGMLQALPNGAGYAIERDTASIPKFLNRLLGLPVYAQNKLFQYFTEICAELIKVAKVDGTYDMGILDIGMDNDRVHKTESRPFRGSGQSGDFVVEMHKILVMRGISWDEVCELRKKHRGRGDGFYTSNIGLNGCVKHSIAFIFGLGIGGANGGANDGRTTSAVGMARLHCINKPNTGRSPRYETIEELCQRFTPMTNVAQAEKLWKEQFDASEQMCHHRYFYGKCSMELKGTFCEVGRRMRTYFVLSGSLICVWPELEEILSTDGKGGKRMLRRRMQIVRVRTDGNHRIVGILVMPSYVTKLVALLQSKCAAAAPVKKPA